MRPGVSILIAVVSVAASLSPGALLGAAPSRLAELSSTEGVLRWINTYRGKPDPAGVPGAVGALSRLGAFKDP